MALKYSPGLLSQLANFGQDLTSQQARSGRGILPSPGGMAGAVRDATRAVGSGLFGLDMRTPQERVQQELKLIKDPTSPEGMLKQAEIFSKLGDPKSLSYAATLATQARTLQEAEKLRTENEKGRAARTAWLENNASEYKALYEEFGMSDDAVDSLIETKRVEDAAKQTSKQGINQKRRAFKALTSIYSSTGGISATKKEQILAEIEQGNFDGLKYEDFVARFKPDPIKATIVNVVRRVDPDDPSKGTVVEGWRKNEEGLFFNPQTNEWDKGNSRGFLRLAGKGADAEKGTSENLSATEVRGLMMRLNSAKAAGLAQNLTDAYTELSQLGDVAVLAAQYASRSPVARAGLQMTGAPAAEVASRLQIAQDSITEFVGRASSGSQIRLDEESKFYRMLVPTAADFNNPRAIFRKLANTELGLGITYLISSDPSGVDNEEAMKTLNAMAAVPVTPEIEELVDEGRFREALDLRTIQLAEKFNVPLSKLDPELAAEGQDVINFENLKVE